MLLKSELEKVYHAQQQLVKKKELNTERSILKNYTPTQKHIEVITGIRRCGKSTLMRQMMRKHPGFAYFNFEDSRVFGFEVSDFTKLDEIMPPNASAYFFDEIQNVLHWETYIRQLHDRGAKVFITGSNASLLSKELGTRLTGRHLRHELYPFSYSEYINHKKTKRNADSFSKYLYEGGFPEYLSSGNEEVLQTLFKDILLRDIAVRHGIRNTKVLIDIALFLLSNTGKEQTYNSIRKNFGLGSTNSASDYLHWMEDSYLLFYVPRFSWKTRNIAANARKVYAIDNGLVQANSISHSDDIGRLLENAVFLHLRQQAGQLYYFRENKECDFVWFQNKKCKMVLQVCTEINSDNLQRETNGLLEAMNYFNLEEGTIVTLNQSDTLELSGNAIRLIPVHEFLK